MKKARFDEHYTTHSLRSSYGTRLYDGGVLEQLIEETSDGFRTCKCTSSAHKGEASEILPGSLSKHLVLSTELKM